MTQHSGPAIGRSGDTFSLVSRRCSPIMGDLEDKPMAAPAAQSNQREGTTRERLLQVAIEMFAERGYAATGVDALCRKAGVAKTGLYWEFQNKAGLLSAVIDRVIADWGDEIRRSAVAGDARERLDLALAAVRRRIRERPELFRIILVVLAERTQVDDDARRALRRFFEVARMAVSAAIQESTQARLPEKELTILSELVLAIIEGLFLRIQVYEDDARIDELFEGCRKTILLMVRDLIATSPNRASFGDISNPTG